MPRFRLLLLSAALLPLLPVPAFAQEIVVTATGAPQDADSTGEAITVVTREDLETRQTVSIADYLATTPGVTLSRYGGAGTVTYLRIRGAEAEQTLVLIDGVRVNDPASPGGAFDFGSLLAGSVERVEVLRGANSVPWGSQAIGGVVNIITEAPGEGLQARARAEAGSHASLYADAAASGRSGALSGAVTAGYRRTDGISAAAIGTEADGAEQSGGSARLGLDLTDAIGLDLRGYYAHSRIDLDGYPSPAFTFADTAEYSTAQELYGYAGLHATFGNFRNRAAVTIADVNRDNYNPAVGEAPSFIGRGRSERYQYQGDIRPLAGLRIVAGAEHEDSRFDDGTTRAATGITSLYGELVIRPFRLLTVTGGVRHDDHDDFGGHTTFGANAALALDTGTTLRASYAEGFKAPTLYQLHGAYGTPDLVPESAKSYDLGVEQHFLDGAARASATWFHRDTIHQIDFDLGTFTYSNTARTRAEGVEFALTLKPAEAFTVTASYTYVDAENRTPGATFGNDLARRPRHAASVSADYRFGSGPAIGATITHVGDSFDDPANAVRLDGYVLADVRADLPITRQLSLYGRVENLFDARYRMVATYGSLGRTAYGGIKVRLD